MSTPTPTLEPLLLTEPEAAKLLSVCPKTLYLLRRQGKIVGIKLGRAIRYEVAAIQDLIAKLRLEAEAVRFDAGVADA